MGKIDKKKESPIPVSKIIYVYLRNEETDCWRPVSATEENGFFRITSNCDAEDEDWEFDTGTLVECGEKKFQDGSTALVAIRKISDTLHL
jgi:hypothetical protein